MNGEEAIARTFGPASRPEAHTFKSRDERGWPVEQHAGLSSGHFHAVRFYEDESSLCRIVAEFLGDGLAAGQPGVVIAVPSHRAGISQGLRALSFDVDRLRRSGDLVVLDAEETLSTFMKSGYPDSDAFRKSVGGVLDQAIGGRQGATVRAFGEMVDWLWKNEAAEAAIRLEVLWNQLATTRAFSLLCGYSMGNFYKHGAYENICGQHTHVVSGAGQPIPIGVA